MLAELLRAEIIERGAAALVITHELEFAAGFADRFWFMDRREHRIIELDPLATVDESQRGIAASQLRQLLPPSFVTCTRPSSVPTHKTPCCLGLGAIVRIEQ